MPLRFYNICPTTNPSQLSFFNNLIHVSGISSCASSLSSIDCTTDLGFTSPGWDNNSSWVNPNNLPANGTGTLSNTAGSGTITAPLSGASLTWTFGAVTTVAVAVEGSGSGSGNSMSSSGNGPATTTTAAGGTGGSAAGTGTTSAPAAMGSKNSAMAAFVVGESYAHRWGLAILSVFALLI